MAKEKLIPFDIQNYLEDEKDCQLYLQACVVEDSGDGKLIKKALEDIALLRTPKNKIKQIEKHIAESLLKQFCFFHAC